MQLTELTVSGMVLTILAPIVMVEVFKRLPDPEWLEANRFPTFPPDHAPIAPPMSDAAPHGMQTGLLNLAAAIPPTGLSPTTSPANVPGAAEEATVLLPR